MNTQFIQRVVNRSTSKEPALVSWLRADLVGISQDGLHADSRLLTASHSFYSGVLLRDHEAFFTGFYKSIISNSFRKVKLTKAVIICDGWSTFCPNNSYQVELAISFPPPSELKRWAPR